YIFLLYLTSISYPLSPKFDFNPLPLILSPVIIGFIIEFMGSGIHGIKTISDSVDLFSVSKRNLRRRKLRTILLLISFIIFTAGSLVLTSFSLEIDLLMASRSNVYGVNGLGLEFRVPEAYSVSGFSDVEAENNPYAMNLLPTIINMPSILGDVENVTFRAESKARVRPYMRLREDISIMGIVSFSDPSDPVAKLVSSTFIEGHPPTNGGEVAVSFSLASKLGLKIGDSLSIMTRRYIICGLFDDNAIYGLRELSGRPVLPYKMILSMKGEDGVPSIYESRVCDPSEVIFIHWSEIDYYKLSKTRAFFTFNHTADIYSIGKTIALRGGNILATVLTSDDCVNMLLAEYLASSGFEAFIPMFLIILNAAISAAASLHERRREVLVMTSLGANPTQTFKIFLNESLVLGFSAGSLGYVLGIVLYKFMSNVSSIEVAPKISFMWVFFSLTLALLSSILGSSIILRSSLVVVPSKLWNIRYTTKSTAEDEVRVFEIPVKLSSSSIEPFLSFISNRLRNYPSTSEEFIKVIGSHVDKVNGKLVYKLIFTYDVGSGSTSKNNSRNVLEVYVENGECRVSLYVKCVGSNPEKHSLNVARLVRHIVMEWGG
ncbi:MAG: FtsX-like permease family protein, partial [Candidatus Methanomethylicia archaeon]